METGGKPKEVAKYLKIGRERVYNIFRKMKKEMRMHNIWKIASRSVENKNKAELVEKLKDFVRDNAHSFYTVNDARDYLTGGTEDDRYPSRSTVRQMLKKEWGLSFKKENVRFKQRWEPEDLMMKARHIWACLWLFENNWALIHVDEFNVTDTSVKQYAWTKRGQQNYWMMSKRAGKLNSIVAVYKKGPVAIHIQERAINAVVFSEFITKIAERVREMQEIERSKVMLVFDNASIHVSKLIDEKLKENQLYTITLPPYTPEYSEAEIAISMIKSKLDSKLKKQK